jgi:hypothetical protein
MWINTFLQLKTALIITMKAVKLTIIKSHEKNINYPYVRFLSL